MTPAGSDAASRTAWLLAGQDLLRAGGVRAVKLHALAARVGRTTGSFYHHFAGTDAYRDELARYFGAEQPAAMLGGIDEPDPRRRLRRLGRLDRDADMATLYAAMRAWGASDPVAAEAVRAADAALLAFVAEAFRDLGYATADARVRAELLFAIGVARLDTPWPPAAGSLRAVLEVLAPTAD
ncbi:MAG: TetR family transcriptional regulator [Acidimicrobiales bacterium]|nr:TetR family transcriptional regulator [Acidimicrobiales bacterium]